MNMQAGTMILMAATVFGAAFIQCLSGIGFGMVGMALLPLFLPLETAIPFVALTAFVTIAYILFHSRRHMPVVAKETLPIIVSALPGAVIGVFALREVDVPALRLVIGATIVLFALFSFFFRDARVSFGRSWGFLFGFLGGMLEGALNIGGPPVVMFLSLRGASKETMRSTMLLYLLCLGVVKLTLFAATRTLSAPILLSSLLLIPVVMGAGRLGHAMFKRISHRTFIYAVNSLLVASGLLNVARSMM